MRAVFKWLADLLYPPKCMLCHRVMESSDVPICSECGYDLPEYTGRRREVPYFEKVVAPFFYEDDIREAVRRFKFHGMRSYASQFAGWMTEPIKAELAGEYDLISWVPCSARRRWARGFDQAELLAQHLSKELHVPCVPVLKKVKNTPKQSQMPNAARRRGNVLGVYKALKPETYFGKRILLVDDVLTTGATLSECGKVLRIAGSGDLVCAVIAAARRNTE